MSRVYTQHRILRVLGVNGMCEGGLSVCVFRGCLAWEYLCEVLLF